MQVRELRIGNWVEGGDHNPVLVNDLPYLDLDNKEGYLINECWADDFHPIPLTPELLQKAGFNQRGVIRKTYNKRLRKGTSYNDFSLSERNEGMWKVQLGSTVLLHQLEHLHQLQNLFFALTGTELAIDLQRQGAALKQMDWLSKNEKRIASGYEPVKGAEYDAVPLDELGGNLDDDEDLLLNDI